MLVEPAGPLNIGSVARLCANFGVSELRLVAPRCDHLGEEALLMAVHGQALLQAAVVNGTLQLKAGLDVGVLLGAPQHPEHQHYASRGSRHHQRGDQAATPIARIICIS